MNRILEHKYRGDWYKRRPDMDLMVSLASRRSDIVDFIETYTLDPIHGTAVSDGSEKDLVTLIIIHSAKGIEGKRVFIPQAQYGMYPFFRSTSSDAEIEEERRILYVAITRAQDELILSNGRDAYQGLQTAGSAEFFLEKVPEDLLKREGEAIATQRIALDLEDLADWE